MSSHPARLIGLCVWRDLHLLSFHKQHPDGKKKKTCSLHISLRAPDANSLYNNLLNMISHKPIKLNKLGVTAGFGHLCVCRRHGAAAQGERKLLIWMLMYCSSSGFVDINASFLWSAKVVYNDGLLAAPSLAFPPLRVLLSSNAHMEFSQTTGLKRESGHFTDPPNIQHWSDLVVLLLWCHSCCRCSFF